MYENKTLSNFNMNTFVYDIMKKLINVTTFISKNWKNTSDQCFSNKYKLFITYYYYYYI